MKIVFYINNFGGGGAERVMANLANHLSHKHEVTVINSYKYEIEYELNENIRHLYMDNNEFCSTIKKNYSRIKFLRNFLKQERPDIAVSFMSEPNIRLILANIGLKTRTIISVRNDPNREYASKIKHFLAKYLLPFADGCVFQTQEAKEWFPRRLQKKSAIILNAVNESFFNVESSNDKKNIVTCGRLTQQKNQKSLITAYSRIKDITDDDLIIYGEGELEQELKEFAKECGVADRVIFAGQVDDVISAIKNAKIFVLSSLHEGMPNALLEAMTLGLACISTDCPCGGPREVISNGHTGILVPINDTEKMANALELLLTNDELRESISKCAKEYAKNTFNPNRIHSEWENYLLRGATYDIKKNN